MNWRTKVQRLEKNRVIDDIAFTVGLLLVAFLYAGAARADNDRPSVPPPTTQAQDQAQDQGQEQAQDQAQSQATTTTVSSGGGQGGGASNQLNMGGDRTTAVALGTTSLIPYGDVPACYLPARGAKRVQAVLWGGVQLGAIVQRDEKCMADLKIARAHELEVARVSADVERAAADRARADVERLLVIRQVCSEIATRELELCASK